DAPPPAPSLDTLATTAAAAPPLASPDQVQYIQYRLTRRAAATSGAGPSTPIAANVYVGDTWISPEGERLEETDGTVSGRWGVGVHEGSFPAAQVAALPTDPALLYAALSQPPLAFNSEPVVAPLWKATELLSQPATPPALRAALIRALGTQPGVT